MKSPLLFVGLLLFQDDGQGRTAVREVRGHGLQERCEAFSKDAKGGADTDVVEDLAVCLSYISGLSDGLRQGGMLCLPEGVTLGQQVAVVRKYLNDHPESLHLPRATLASSALTAAFRCKS